MSERPGVENPFKALAAPLESESHFLRNSFIGACGVLVLAGALKIANVFRESEETKHNEVAACLLTCHNDVVDVCRELIEKGKMLPSEEILCIKDANENFCKKACVESE